MKPAVFLTLLFSFICSYSQVQPPEAYISFGGFFEEQLKPNAYFNFSLGTELFAYKFIAPEIDYTYYFGGDENEDSEVDNMGDINFRSSLHRNFDSWVWGVGPKLFIQDDYNRFVFIPKYHFGRQKSTGNYYDSLDLDIEQESKTKFNFWSFSLGYEFIGEERIGKTGIYLTYTGFNAGKSLNQLDFFEPGYNQNNYNTKAIGLTVRLSSGFGKRKD